MATNAVGKRRLLARDRVADSAQGHAQGHAQGALAELDLESRLGGQDHQALKLWLRMLSCTTRVEGVIRKRLAQDFASTLPRFDLLAQLERHPQGLSMRELSRRLMVTGGNITGITDQLEAEGLVLRDPHPSDRRSITVKLTALGRRQFKPMASTHEQWVLELLGGWSSEQQGQVYALLAELKQHLSALEQAPQEPVRAMPRTRSKSVAKDTRKSAGKALSQAAGSPPVAPTPKASRARKKAPA